MQALASSMIVVLFLPYLLIGLAVAYIALRIRDARAEHPDPELGVKSAYYFFLTAGIFLALAGLSISAIDVCDSVLADKAVQPRIVGGAPGKMAPGFNPQFNPPPQNDNPFESLSQRIAWPLVISGLLFSFVSLLLVKLGTNDDNYPAVRRTFVGLRLSVAGLVVMASLTLLIVLLFQKDLQNMQPYAWGIGLMIVWAPTTAIHVFLLKLYAKQPYYVAPKPKKQKIRHEEDLVDDEEDRPRRKPTRRRDEDDEDD